MTDHQKTITGRVQLTASFSARVKHSFSPQHLEAARRFAAAARGVEEGGPSALTPSIQGDHRANVTASIMSAVAFLEASINELFLEARDNHRQPLLGLSEEGRLLLATQWHDVQRFPTLRKYQTVLVAAGAAKFDKCAALFHDASDLVKLRNALVHYEPNWDDELGKHDSIEKRLRGKFDPNPMVSSRTLWFPHQCLGAGCAEWCVRVAEDFSRQFTDRLGIPSRVR